MSKPEAQMTFTLVADDETWEIDVLDFDGPEWKAMKAHVPGVTMQQAVAALSTLDAEILAVMLWAWRRRDEPDLTFERCLKSISLRAVMEGFQTAAEEEGEAKLDLDVSDPS